VVDGYVNTTPGDTTYITLSRTRNLVDSEQFSPEVRATVTIESKGGQVFHMLELGKGIYYLLSQAFIPGEDYRLHIRTYANSEYASAWVPNKVTPAIDSITWNKSDQVSIYAFTHDPNNNTRYYRWDYDETWEYDAYFDSNLGWDNNRYSLYYKDSADLTYRCYRHGKSQDIAIGTSANLAQDVIDSQRVALVANASERISVKYSILVKQFALTKDAFEYWQLLKKNSNQLGTIFDPQPSQVTGNMTCLSNPQEPVIGYISTSTVSRKRIFIHNYEVAPWGFPSQERSCPVKILNDPDSAIYYLQDGKLGPAYYVTGGGLAIAPTICIDCRTRGGSTIKPDFW